MSLLHHGHIHDAVDVLNLRHLYRNLDDLLDRDNFLYHFGDLGDVLLNDWLLTLDRLLEHITQVTKVVEEVVPVQKVVQVPVEVPQVQYIDRVVDVPVVKQRHVPSVQKVQKTVVQQRHVPAIQKVQKPVTVPVIETVERVVD